MKSFTALLLIAVTFAAAFAQDFVFTPGDLVRRASDNLLSQTTSFFDHLNEHAKEVINHLRPPAQNVNKETVQKAVDKPMVQTRDTPTIVA